MSSPAWVLPYVYALRGDRDWRRSPQLTGSRQVSPLAIQAYKQLESADMTIAELKQNLGHGVTEAAVLRAITELWQQLRIIPVVAAPGKAAKWQLLRHRFQKAIAEGASTSQVTAISVLASIFLQAVIAASMEEVEIFLSPLTARSKIREVIRGLVATRQVHTLSLGHAPHFYVAGTLPEFAPAVTTYTSSIGSSYLPYPHDEEPVAEPAPIQLAPQREELPPAPAETHELHAHANGAHRPAPKPAASRPHFSRAARDRKPAASESNSRRPAKGRTASRSSSSRPAGARWASNGSKTAHTNGSSRNGNGNGNHAASKNGSNGHARPAGTARPANGSRPTAARSAKPAARSASLSRPPRRPQDLRPQARTGHIQRLQALRLQFQAGIEEARMSEYPRPTGSSSGARGIIVAIDGPAGAGESTIARHLARHFGLLNLETGAMYRAFALKALRDDVPLDDSAALERLSHETSIRLEPGDAENRVLLDGEDVTGLLRNQTVTDAASKVSVFLPSAHGWSAFNRSSAPPVVSSWKAATSAPSSFPTPTPKSSSTPLPRSAACAASIRWAPLPRNSRKKSSAICANATSATATAPTRPSAPLPTPCCSTPRTCPSTMPSKPPRTLLPRASLSTKVDNPARLHLATPSRLLTRIKSRHKNCHLFH